MTEKELAYVAGFLDGDGCVMLQLVYRHDYILGYQIRSSIVFYQKQQNRLFLEWLKRKIGGGYIRNRNDGMSEYTIVGVKSTTRVLKQFRPYLRLKRKQAAIALSILAQMPGQGRQMKPRMLLKLAQVVDIFSELNYSKKRTNNSAVVREFLLSHNLLGSRRD